MTIKGTAIGSLGSYSTYKPGDINTCPVGGSWEDWCDCVYAPDDPLNAQCKTKPGSLIPPFIPLAPWTEAGAGARHLPHADSVAGTVFNIGNFDPEEFKPLALWRVMWENPARYAILIWKMQFIPLLGQLYTVIAANPANLVVSALAQCAAEGKDPYTYVAKPLIENGPANAAWAYGAMTNGIGAATGDLISGIKLAGMIAQKAARDTIKDGSYNWLRDDFSRAAVNFLSESGEAIANAVADAVRSASTIDKDATVWRKIARASESVSRVSGFSQGVRDAARQLALIFDIIADIANGFAGGKAWSSVIDDILERLIGVRVVSALSLGGDAVVRSFQQAGKTTNDIDSALKNVDNIVGAINNLTSTITSIAGKFDPDNPNSAINQLVQQFAGTIAFFTDASTTLSEKLVAAKNTLHAAQAIGKDSRSSVIKTAAATKRAAMVLPTKQAPTSTSPVKVSQPSGIVVKPPPAKSSATPLVLVGAGAGALVGGPPGALLGAGAGLILSALGKK